MTGPFFTKTNPSLTLPLNIRGGKKIVQRAGGTSFPLLIKGKRRDRVKIP